ncbi:MAG: 2-oxo acid dehydrogenase subunit E2 [Christensenella sp.]|nr:2-oxo acid dehydrogenase subunit E2 [Christensenella sp.]
MEQKTKRRRGDRRDATLVRDLDSMHVFMPIMMPNRADNEAFIQELIDMSAVEAYLERKNAQSPQYKYTFFHVILAALARTIEMRPRMNRFIIGNRYFDRDHISFSFIVKKAFSDSADESVMILKYDPASEKPAIDMIHDKICDFVYSVRQSNKKDGTTDILDTLAKTPMWMRKLIVTLLRTLDNNGVMPKDLADEDPYNSTVFISNLGSIKLNAGYHHLSNWSTNSVFVVVGERHMQPFYGEDGGVIVKPALNLGLTLDERIADGYYYSKTVRLLKKFLSEPELLDIPSKEALNIEY